MSYLINNAIPGLSGLTSGATSIINSALAGLPSPSESRLQNAYFGAGSGLDPTSDFLRNRGYDLYGSKAAARQRGGIQDLLSLVGTYSGNVAPTPGQEMQNQQQTAQLNQQGEQFNTNFGFEQQQWQKQLELLQQYLNPAGGTGGGGYGNVANSGGLAPGTPNYAQRYANPWDSVRMYGNSGNSQNVTMYG